MKSQRIAFTSRDILRYPRLDTLLMVEERIQKAKEYPTKAKLYKGLPKKLMYQTFNIILDYLEYSGKIHIGKDGQIVWIWDPAGVKKHLFNRELIAK